MPTAKQLANLKTLTHEQALENGRKGGLKSGAKRKAAKEALDVFRGARENTTQEELIQAFKVIKQFAKKGSLDHWHEWLRLIGQEELTDTTVRVVMSSDLEELAK